MVHHCNRDDCPPTNVTGPKTKCIKCGNLCFLRCFGFVSCEIGGQDAVKLNLSDVNVVYMFVSQFAFVCCSDSVPATTLKQALKLPSTRSSSKSRAKPTESNETSIANEILIVKDMLMAIKASGDANTMEIGKKLDVISGDTNDIRKHTTVMVDKATRPFQCQMNPPSLNTPISNRLNPTAKTPRPSYADALGSKQSIKRKRTETTLTANAMKPKFNGPPPKTGTKTTITGLSVVAKSKPIEKPKFTKAVWVSRFDPSTTCDEITNYIMENTKIDDKTKFNVHKLVKKDQDLSQLKFVSFKLEVNNDLFDTLKDENLWPEDVWVREFVRQQNFGDFLNFPDLNAKKSRTSPTEAMDTSEKSTSKPNSPI